jgi:hypothetical protein
MVEPNEEQNELAAMNAEDFSLPAVVWRSASYPRALHYTYINSAISISCIYKSSSEIYFLCQKKYCGR